jgi:hypothetical protein
MANLPTYGAGVGSGPEEDGKGVRFEIVDGEEVCVIPADHPDAAGFAREAAEQHYPKVEQRVEQLIELLSTGMLLAEHGDAETVPDGQVEAAEGAARGIVDALIDGVAPQLAGFLKDGQSADVADQIDGWLMLATQGAYRIDPPPVTSGSPICVRSTR